MWQHRAVRLKEMRIILCGRTFPAARETLAPLLPDDETLTVDTADLHEGGAGGRRPRAADGPVSTAPLLPPRQLD